jgi:hypothetical protein
MNKIIGLILVASLTACGGSSGSSGGGSSDNYSAPSRTDLALSDSDLNALSNVPFSSASVTGFVAPNNYN